MRKAKAIHYSIFVFIFLSMVSMNFSIPFGDFGSKFSLSNLVQIILVIVSLIFVRLSMRAYLFLLFFASSSILSIMFAVLNYGIPGRLFVVLFMLVSLGYVFFGIKLCYCGPWDLSVKSFNSSMKSSLYFLAILYPLMFLYQTVSGLTQVSFGMDDKSHATIILGFLSFLSLVYMGRFAVFFSVYFWFMGLLTISRLPFVFLPFMLLSVFLCIKKSQSLKLKLFSFIFFVIAIISLTSIVATHPEYFAVLDRVSSVDTVKSSDSTTAHNLLIKKSIELKFINVTNFIFGVSPGAFGEVLVSSTVPYNDISNIDPQFIAFARDGMAPVHSTHFAIFSEYPIWIFIMYIGYLISVVYRAIKYKLLYLLMFFIPFNVSILYYSAHNKFYFFVIYLVIELLLLQAERKSKWHLIRHGDRGGIIQNI